MLLHSYDDLFMYVKITDVWRGAYRHEGPVANHATASVRLGVGRENRIVLFCGDETVAIDEDFILRRVNVEGYGPSDPDNPYHQSGRTMLATVWNDSPAVGPLSASANELGRWPMQVMYAAHPLYPSQVDQYVLAHRVDS